ncbi:unnamed protein product [Sphenostylis stenocarpa]|uniref:Uncharacterized protein n=1 Tax=Sphenostylis stenocarpa TaxID=92480 RepID=A0AA86S6A5_9FABA|nr:unnamed protein product [Sphenostylis stenocarpa]
MDILFLLNVFQLDTLMVARTSCSLMPTRVTTDKQRKVLDMLGKDKGFMPGQD